MADQASGALSPWLRRKRLSAVTPHLRGRVLDYGCSVGDLCELVSDRSAYYGYDLDVGSVELAQAKYPGVKFAALPPTSEEQFDTVASLAVIEHVSDPVAYLVSLADHLAPRGQVVITTPNPALEWAHHWGSKVGLFSEEADEEHESLLGKKDLLELATTTGLELVRYERFLFGANQLAVFGAR